MPGRNKVDGGKEESGEEYEVRQMEKEVMNTLL